MENLTNTIQVLKKINIKIIIFFLLSISLISFLIIYNHFAKIKETKSYFDLYLANNYNNLTEDAIDKNYIILSNSKNSNISFFADLKMSNLSNIDKYNEFEKNLIVLKHSILNSNLDQLKNLQTNKFFNKTSEIYYLNKSLDNLNIDLLVKEDPSFFNRAVNFYLNDN
ncbi:MAG: hypothetical protein CMI90_05795 [Pelagibacteraceae bacterium]|nr:hypothetical protein [Pelagibacteraceae bacterium]|tara:strand:- start:178 stop:681 length:504 start_codon:yes stop_codon:yes gene_type:complete